MLKRISTVIIPLVLALLFVPQLMAQAGGSIELYETIGEFETGKIDINSMVTFRFRVNNFSNDVIQGMTNGFLIYSPDNATWTESKGEAVGADWESMFDLIYTVNHFGCNGSVVDSIMFGGAALPGSGLPDSFHTVGYEITVGPFDASDEGKTLCIDSSFLPPSSLWLWQTDNSIPLVPSWDGPHCFTIATDGIIDPPPDFETAITLDTVIGLKNEDSIYAGQEVSFMLRLQNNLSQNIGGMTNGFVVYSPDGAEWGSTYGDTIGMVGGELFDLGCWINYFSVDGIGADTLGFAGVRLFGDGLAPGFNNVEYKITIGPIDSSQIGKTICLDSTFFPPSGIWKWSGSGFDADPYWSGPHCYSIASGEIVDPPPPDFETAITLDTVLGLKDEGTIYSGQEVSFMLRLQNELSENIAGLTNGFVVYSPDGAEWGTTYGDTIGMVGMQLFDLGFWINSFSTDGFGADTVAFAGVRLVGDGLALGFNNVEYKITIGPIDSSQIGKTICLDSTFFPPSGIWKWGGSGFDSYPYWSGPHCYTIGGPSVQPVETGAITLDHVDGLKEPGVIYSNVDVSFYLRVQNFSGVNMVGVSNGFSIYSPDGAEWTRTEGDTIGMFGTDVFELFKISNNNVDGAVVDTIGFLGQDISHAGMPGNYDAVEYKITIGPIDSSYIGRTICLDSSYFGPAGYWKWASQTSEGYYPSWGGPYCFEIAEPGIVYDSLSNDELIIPPTPWVDQGQLTMVPVIAKTEYGINGATVPLKIPEGIDIVAITRDSLLTETWDYFYPFIKPDSGFIFVSLSNSFDAYIPPGETSLFNIIFRGANERCYDSTLSWWDTALMGDVSRQLTFASRDNYPIYPEFNSHNNYIVIPPYGLGDVDNSGQVDISDLLYLVDFMYFAGPSPYVVNVNDVNGDCVGPDIADMTYLSHFMFNYGPYPQCGCLVNGNGKLAPMNEAITLETSYENGVTKVYLNSPLVSIRGVEFKMEADNAQVLTLESDSRFDLVYNNENNILRGAILDMDGVEYWTEGRHLVLEIDGEVELTYGGVSDISHNSYRTDIGLAKLIPESLGMSQNYPNPFNPNTVIKFQLPAATDVVIEVYNIAGQKVTDIANGRFDAGEHEIEWDAGQYSSGVYLYRMTAGNFVETKKMILLK